MSVDDDWTRRAALKAGAIGIASLALPGCADPASPSDPFADVDPTQCDLETLAASLVDEPSDGLIPLGVHLEAGVPTDRLFGAALLVAARSIPPDADLHDVLFVPAACFLSERLTRDGRKVMLARAWHKHVTSAPSALEPMDPERIPVDEGEAMALIEAFEAWDGAAAQRAVARRYFDHGPAGIVDPLVRYGARNHDWVGHTAIWTSMALRASTTLGWDCAPWLMRSVAGAISGNQDRSVADDFAINQARAAELPADWRRGVDRPEAVPALIDRLLLCEPQGCVDAVIEASWSGLSQRTIWTALAVAAVEHTVRWNSPSFGVHEVDALNALRTLQGFATSDETARLVLLQAAAWRGLFQALDPQPPGIETRLLDFAADAPPFESADEVVDAMLGSRPSRSHAIAGYFANGGAMDALQAKWAEAIAANAGRDAHHVKYHTALMEEIDAALPEYRAALATGMVMRGPTARGAPWRRYDEAVAL